MRVIGLKCDGLVILVQFLHLNVLVGGVVIHATVVYSPFPISVSIRLMERYFSTQEEQVETMIPRVVMTVYVVLQALRIAVNVKANGNS